MTLLTTLSAAPARRGFATAIAAFASRVMERIALARARAETRAILSGLDDTTLKDIGLHRSEILSVSTDGTTDRRRVVTF